MPCAAAASDRIHASVRPAIGMSWNASAIEKSSSNADVIARPPAPPVSTRVPSMSNRISVGTFSDQPSLRTLPARGPLADGSSSKLTR